MLMPSGTGDSSGDAGTRAGTGIGGGTGLAESCRGTLAPRDRGCTTSCCNAPGDGSTSCSFIKR